MKESLFKKVSSLISVITLISALFVMPSYVEARGELVDVILVSGQSNSEDWSGGTNYSIERDRVFVYDGKDLIDHNDYTNRNGISVPLAIRWNELVNDNKKTVVINTGKSGVGTTYFMEGSQGYTDTQTKYQEALTAIEKKGWTIDKKMIFWLQGEGNAYDAAETYYPSFNKMITQWQEDKVCGRQDMIGFIVNRSWFSSTHDGVEDKYLTAPRGFYYSSDYNRDDNLVLVGIVTDQWTDDATVKNYFTEKYGTSDNYKAKFNADMPATIENIVATSGGWNGHYNLAGFTEVGTDAAEKAYDYFYNNIPAKEIVVLDGKGNTVGQNDVIKLYGNRTTIGAYLSPVGSQGDAITLDTNDYFKLNTTSGTLTQVKTAPNDTVELTFRSGSLSKTVKVEAFTATAPILFEWTMNTEDGDDTKWRFANTQNGGDNNYLRWGDKVTDGKLSLTGTLQLAVPITLPKNEEWSVKIDGTLYATPSNDMSFITFANDNGSTSGKAVIKVSETDGYIAIGDNKAYFDELESWGTISNMSDYMMGNGMTNYNPFQMSESYDNLTGYANVLANGQHTFELKNVWKKGSFKLYFVVDGEEIEFDSPLTENIKIRAFAGEKTFTSIDNIEVKTDAWDTDINKVAATKSDGTVTVKVTEKNSKNMSINRVILALRCTDGKMQETVVIRKAEKVASTFEKNYSHTFADFNEGDIIKCFIWDSFSGIKPITLE